MRGRGRSNTHFESEDDQELAELVRRLGAAGWSGARALPVRAALTSRCGDGDSDELDESGDNVLVLAFAPPEDSSRR